MMRKPSIINMQHSSALIIICLCCMQALQAYIFPSYHSLPSRSSAWTRPFLPPTTKIKRCRASFNEMKVLSSEATRPLKRHTAIPISKPGRDLFSLQVNERLTGSIMSLYQGSTCKKAFVDVGVSRKGKDGLHYPVFGMIRLQGRFENKTFSEGQKVDVYADRVLKDEGRLVVRLTPVYRRPERAADGTPLPIHNLKDLRIGTPLNGTIVSLTENYAFVDVGVVKEIPGLRKPRRINGQLYRLDLLEKYAMSSKYKGAKTEAVLERGMNLQVYVKGVHPQSSQLTLTVDPEMNEEKTEALKKERADRFTAMKKKQNVEDLLVGECRKGVITKILPGGVKVGIGAKVTGFCDIDSIADVYGREIRDLSKILVIGGRLQVEIDEITDDGRIDLRCMEIYKQDAPPPKKKTSAVSTTKTKPAVVAKRQEEDDDDEEGDMYLDDDDDDDNKLGYDDEW